MRPRRVILVSLAVAILMLVSLPGDTQDLGRGQPSIPYAGSSGGAKSYHVVAVASDNHATIDASPGTVWDVDCSGAGTVPDYVRLYNAGAGFNGCNSATNLVWGMLCPQTGTAGAGFVKVFPVGRVFSTGVSICVTGGGAIDTDTTAAHATTVVNVGYY